ncbi:MAG: GNAT family N-acetyltransferase [Chloroflexi bacterium]|nr:GNAT family N-acetyltransferase [Chloroflexota bacterium]
MVDTALPNDRQAASAEYSVERLVSPAAIRPLLVPEGAYAAYALAQLAPPFLAHSEWWSASGPAGRALVLHSRGGLGRAMVTLGDATALDALLRLHPGPRFSFASLRPEHREVLQRYFILIRNEPMVRMSVTKETFRPVEGETSRLLGRDIGRINRLYAAEGGPASYTSRHVDQGVYYGIIANGKLVSIAGTHVNSPGERIAVAGNVFTHPLHRGGGLATIATSAVTHALLEHCDLVALTVEVSNTSALAVYDKLGYRQECTLYETPAVRKDALGLASGLRRLAAGWRGRHQGKEIVFR